MLERDIGIGGVHVCPSHADVESKLITVGSCGFTVTECSLGTLVF